MKNTIVLSLGLCLPFLTVYAQDRSSPGYIVRVSGDTVRGFLKEQGTNESSTQISFKATADAREYQVYSPGGVKAFQYDGGDLFRAIAYADTRDTETTHRTNFARLLVTGEYDLYSFTEKDILFFLVRKDTSFYFIFDDDISQVPMVPGNFRNELNFFAVSCDGPKLQTEKVNYNPGDVAEFFRKLDACVNPTRSVTSYYSKPKGKLSFFAYGGGLPVGSRYQYSLEAGLRLTWPQLSPGVSLNLGFRYVYKKTRIADPNYLIVTIWHPETYKITSFPIYVQYRFTRGIVQPFVYGGLAAMSYDDITDVQKVGDDPYYHKFGLQVVAGGGVEVRLLPVLRVRAEWQYEYISEYPTIGLELSIP